MDDQPLSMQNEPGGHEPAPLHQVVQIAVRLGSESTPELHIDAPSPEQSSSPPGHGFPNPWAPGRAVPHGSTGQTHTPV